MLPATPLVAMKLPSVLLVVLLAVCSSVAAYPLSSAANGSVLLDTAFDGNLTLSAGSGYIAASSLFAANGGIALNGTLLDEALLLRLIARLEALEANAALLDSMVVSPPMPPPSPAPPPSPPSLPPPAFAAAAQVLWGDTPLDLSAGAVSLPPTTGVNFAGPVVFTASFWYRLSGPICGEWQSVFLRGNGDGDRSPGLWAGSNSRCAGIVWCGDIQPDSVLCWPLVPCCSRGERQRDEAFREWNVGLQRRCRVFVEAAIQRGDGSLQWLLSRPLFSPRLPVAQQRRHSLRRRLPDERVHPPQHSAPAAAADPADTASAAEPPDPSDDGPTTLYGRPRRVVAAQRDIWCAVRRLGQRRVQHHNRRHARANGAARLLSACAGHQQFFTDRRGGCASGHQCVHNVQLGARDGLF